MVDTSSVSGIVKNIFTFANILNQAGTEAAQKWDQQSISNAFNWAKYCENIYHQVKSKCFAKELDDHIKMLTLHHTPPSFLMLDLKSLERASDLLYQVLLRNPMVRSHHLIDVTDRLLTHEGSLMKVLHGSLEEVNHLNVTTDLQYQIFLEPHDISEVSLYSQAVVMIKSLLLLCEECETQKKSPRFKIYLEALLRRMQRMKNGMGSIVSMLVVGEDLVKCQTRGESIKRIHTNILTWLKQASNLHVEDIPRCILRRASEYQEEFMHLYLASLTHWVDQMEKIPEGAESPVLYSWRYKSRPSECRDWNALCEHFLSLVKSDLLFVKRTVILLLKERRDRNHVYFNVYRDIISQLERMDK